MATQDSPSLYERLGGGFRNRTVIDEFFYWIMVDPRLNANRRVNEAHHRAAPQSCTPITRRVVAAAIVCTLSFSTAIADPNTETHTNRLFHSASPYLLQHAHNPVDWYPWGEEAFAKARAENKLI